MIIKKKYLMLCLIIFITNAFSISDKSINIENHIRYGYDDNLSNTPDSQGDAVDSLYLSDIFNITAKIIPSDQSTLLFFYQPELTYRFDADDEFLYLQDMYLNYMRSLSPVSQFQLTDRFRISEPDLNQIDGRSFTENDLKASYVKNINKNTGINLLFGYTERKNEDNTNRQFDTRDFKRTRLAYLLSRNLDEERKTLSGGINFNDHQIQHEGGSIKTTTIFAGYDYAINNRLQTSTQLGYTFGDINRASGSSTTNFVNDTSNSESPFFEVGMNYILSKNTKINSSYSYSLRYTTLSLYNAEIRSDFLIAIQHKFTPKISLALSLSKVNSDYESEFLRLYSGSESNLKDSNTIINLRGEYLIDRNHAIEYGYQNRERNGWDPASQSYSRNKVYLGWKLNM